MTEIEHDYDSMEHTQPDDFIIGVQKIANWAEYNAIQIPIELIERDHDTVYYTLNKETGNATLFTTSLLVKKGDHTVCFHQAKELENDIMYSDSYE